MTRKPIPMQHVEFVEGGQARFIGNTALSHANSAYKLSFNNTDVLDLYSIDELRQYAQLTGMLVDDYLHLWFNRYDMQHRAYIHAWVKKAAEQHVLHAQREAEWGAEPQFDFSSTSTAPTPHQVCDQLTDSIRRREQAAQSEKQSYDRLPPAEIKPFTVDVDLTGAAAKSVKEQLDKERKEAFAKERMRSLKFARRTAHELVDRAFSNAVRKEEDKHGKNSLVLKQEVQMDLNIEWGQPA